MEKINGKEDRVRELVNEYREKRPLFVGYTRAIRLLLASLLKKHGIQFQTIQFRTKEGQELHRKLLKKLSWQNMKLIDLTDLSGCRVIFYVEESLDLFARILHDEFEIVEDEVKISPDEYNARHVIVKLKENRLSLPEYAEFKGLHCEIQLTSILYHAWSEMQHDVIYKPNEQLLDFDKPTFDYIKTYFNEIMEKHLKKASRGFSYIFYEFSKIKHGQVLVNPLAIDAISKSTSNSDMYNYLKLLHEYSAKYARKLPCDYNLIDALESVLDSAEKNPIIDRKTIFGDLKGIAYLDIADVVLDIVDSLRYYDVRNTLCLIIRIGKQKELQRRCEESLRRIATYNIGILHKYGYHVQNAVLNYVSEQKPEYILENLDLILTLVEPIASLECEDTSMDSFETITFRKGCLKPNSALEGIRATYFKLTTSFLQLVKTDVDRKKTLNTMFSLTYQVHSGETSEDVVALLSADAVKITDFLITYYDLASNIVKKDIERFVFHLERYHFKERFVNLAQLREKLSNDVNYARFRIFYGNDVDFYPDFDFRAAQEFRKQKIEEFVQQINETNLEEWLSLFRELLANCQAGIGFMYFSTLLRRLGEQKPAIAFRLLDIKELSVFLGSILSGLIDGPEQEKVKKLLSDYSRDKTKQLATVQTILSKKDYDDTLFKELYPNLLETTDTTVLLMLLQTIAKNYSSHKNHKEKATAIISKFTALNYFSWSFVCHIQSDYWKEMSDENTIAILENLKYCSSIDYDEECMLNSIAERNPKAVIGFFHDRVRLSKDKEISDPIPFEFLVINATLSRHHKEVLPEIIKWFSEEDQLENWYASKLIANIFHSFGPDLENFLLNIVQKNDTRNLKVVLFILEEYEGQPFLHNVVKEIVKLHPIDEALRTTLCHILSKTGVVVGGEYGFLDAYKLKEEQMKDWLTDSNAKIKEFAVTYNRYLDDLSNRERNRADREIEFRKREFEINRKQHS